MTHSDKARALAANLAAPARIFRALRYDVFGGPEGDRTPDLRIANAALSQLSYEPNSNDWERGLYPRRRGCQASGGEPTLKVEHRPAGE